MESISFEKAQELVPNGVNKLTAIRSRLDEVSYLYAELYIKEFYEFLLDSKGKVWVITDRPEEPAYWNEEKSFWTEREEDE